MSADPSTPTSSSSSTSYPASASSSRLSPSSLEHFVFPDNRFTSILPVLFYEYLALSLSKSVIPGMIIEAFGDYSYFVVGFVETCKGVLSFIACPFFGKLSDEIGRRRCLLATVIGTTFPVVVMVFTRNMWLFSFFVILSGFFTATFPLTFAYISDLVEKKHRYAHSILHTILVDALSSHFLLCFRFNIGLFKSIDYCVVYVYMMISLL